MPNILGHTIDFERFSWIRRLGSISVRRAFAGLSLLFLSFILLSLSIVGGVHHDEDQYILGAYFSQHHTIYKDFLYLQPPFHAILLSYFFTLFGQFGYFFVARLTTFLFASGLLVVFYLILRTVLQSSRSIALVFCLFLVFTSNFYIAAMVARNDLMPLFFSLLAVYLMLWVSPSSALRELQLAVAGLCIAIAVGTKLNYVQMPLAAIMFLTLWPRHMAMTKRLSQQVVPLAAGGLLGTLFILLFAASDIYAFLNGVFSLMINQPTEYIALHPDHFTMARSIHLAMQTLTQPSLLALSILALCFFVYIIGNGLVREFVLYVFNSGQWLIWLILLLGIPIVLLVIPSNIRYFISVVPFFILCIASLWSSPPLCGLKPVTYVMVFAAVMIGCTPSFKYIIESYTVRLFDRKYWTPLVVLDRSRRIDALLDAAGVPGKIATLSPALLIESKRGFYLELATGSFFYRQAAYMPIDSVERLHGTSPAALPTLFSGDRPAAIFGGYEKGFDNALFEFAEAHGYRRVDENLGGGILYIRQPPVAQDR